MQMAGREKLRAYVVLGMLLAMLQSLAFSAALSGAGCTTGGNCVVNATQTIDTGGSYYFNSLVINPGVTITMASPGNGAGGTVRFYVAGDANISGTIEASASTTYGGSNPDGGGYGAYLGGAGGAMIAVYASTINFNGAINAKASNGWSTGGGVIAVYGGGSGGTVRLVARKLNCAGTINVNGGPSGTGSDSAGGGAGGSVIIDPLSISKIYSGSISANGGASAYGNGGGAGGSGGTGKGAGTNIYWYGGAGSGGAGGNSNSPGVANPGRDIKIYNSIIPAGSTFSVSSTGSTAGLLDLYNSPSASAYSGLAVTQRAETAQVTVLGQYSAPVSGTVIKAANISNSSTIFAQNTTDSNGIAHFWFSVPAEGFDIIAEPVIPGGAIGLSVGKSADLSHASGSLTTLDQQAHLYLRRLDLDLFKPDGSKQQYFFAFNNSLGELTCAGYLSTSGQVSCFLVRSDINAAMDRLNDTVWFNTSSYSVYPAFGGIQVPNSITVGGNSTSTKLQGMASADLMRAGMDYVRTVFYTPTAASESNFAYTETIPSDFAFGGSAHATMAQTGGALLNCTFSTPSSGKTITFSSSNCPILATALTFGNWLRFDYDIVAPQPDSFFGASQNYVFNQGSLQVSASSG